MSSSLNLQLRVMTALLGVCSLQLSLLLESPASTELSCLPLAVRYMTYYCTCTLTRVHTLTRVCNLHSSSVDGVFPSDVALNCSHCLAWVVVNCTITRCCVRCTCARCTCALIKQPLAEVLEFTQDSECY